MGDSAKIVSQRSAAHDNLNSLLIFQTSGMPAAPCFHFSHFLIIGLIMFYGLLKLRVGCTDFLQQEDARCNLEQH